MLKHSSNFESVQKVWSSNVVEYEFRRISNCNYVTYNSSNYNLVTNRGSSKFIQVPIRW